MDNQPECPPLGVYLWNYYGQIASTRQSGGMGPARLSRAEIRLWEEDEGCPLARWERRVILAIDAAWFAAAIQANDPAQQTEVTQ